MPIVNLYVCDADTACTALTGPKPARSQDPKTDGWRCKEMSLTFIQSDTKAGPLYFDRWACFKAWLDARITAGD